MTMVYILLFTSRDHSSPLNEYKILQRKPLVMMNMFKLNEDDPGFSTYTATQNQSLTVIPNITFPNCFNNLCKTKSLMIHYTNKPESMLITLLHTIHAFNHPQKNDVFNPSSTNFILHIYHCFIISILRSFSPMVHSIKTSSPFIHFHLPARTLFH